LYDSSSRKIVDFSNVKNMTTAVEFLEISSTTREYKPAVEYFSFLKLKGDIYTAGNVSPKKVKQIKFEENDTGFECSFALIPNQRGIYTICIGDAQNVSTIDKPCTFALFMYRYSNIDKHLYYAINYKQAPLSSYEEQHCYCFKVK